MSLQERLQEVRQRIAQSLELSGRPPGSVALVAVSKTHPGWLMKAAFDLGQRAFGENKVQEAEAKAAELSPLAVDWHLVGHLQRNKVRSAVALFSTIHSVDSLPLLERIDRLAGESGRRLTAMLQVDLAGEATKSGVPPAVLPELLRRAADMPHVDVAGLMILPPFHEDAERARPYFRKMRELREELNAAACYRAPLTELSMGMSHDFDIAISEGATVVRVGTSIFGERHKA